MNFPKIAQSAYEIARFYFRAFHVVPLRYRVLVESVRHAVASPPLHESGDDLHVKDPARQKWCGEHVAQRISGSEELGTTLRVVDGQSETGRDQRRSDAPHIMPRRAPADVAAEKPDARAEDHVDFRTCLHDLQKAGKLRERRRQIGIPESDEIRGALQCGEDAASHRFSLAAVPLQSQN